MASEVAGLSVLGTFRRLWMLLDGRRRRQLALLPLPMLVGTFLEILSVGTIPIFIALLIDRERVASAPVVGPWIARLPDWQPEQLLLVGGCTLGALFIVRGLYLVCLQHIVARFTNACARDIGTRLFRLYLHAPYTFHLNHNSAELIRNTNVETQRCGQQVISALLQVLLSSLLLVGICVPVIAADPLLATIVIVGGGGVTLLLLRALRGVAVRQGRQLTIQNGLLLKAAQEGLGAYKDLWLRGNVGHVVDRFHRVMRRRAHALYVHQFVVQCVKPILETFGVVALLLVPIVLVLQGAKLVDVVPMLTLLAIVAARLLPTVSQLAQQLVRLRSNTYTLALIQGEFNTLEGSGGITRYALQGPAENIAFNDAIVLEGVTFIYPGAERPAVEKLSLTIPRGSAVAFVGPTGAGKSTAVDLIIGLLQPTAGHILVDDADLTGHMSGWQRRIGYIPQAIYLLDDTIRRNVAIGLPDDMIDEAAVERALSLAQLDDLVVSLPQGLDTLVGERGTRISGGQRQRLGIARALYHDPSVLVLDEATSAVDNVTERKLMAAIESARSNRTLIMIAHRLSTVRNCDMIYYMKDGRLAAAGNFDTLRQENMEFDALAM